jgi:glucose-1-phosphate thymidylyltransferase
MKGIILAGGKGTRLYPITKGISKQLLPIYDKPMIYYPLSVLMLAGIQEIMIITTIEDQENYKKILGNGEKFGVSLNYTTQEEPRGIAEAFIIAEDFISNDNVCLILGDNIFYGQGLTPILKKSTQMDIGATIFSYNVNDPENYGVINFNPEGKIESFEEKPTNPKSNTVVTGLYFYDNEVTKIAKTIKPSIRGELEISSINQIYFKKDQLQVVPLGRGFAWLDTGSYENLLNASEFIGTIEKRQGYKIACLEEIGYNNGWIKRIDIEKIATEYKSNSYGDYLLSMLNQNHRNDQS